MLRLQSDYLRLFSVPTIGQSAISDCKVNNRESLLEIDHKLAISDSRLLESRRAGEKESRRAGEQESRRAGEQESRRAGEHESRRAGEQESRRVGEHGSRGEGEKERRRVV